MSQYFSSSSHRSKPSISSRSSSLYGSSPNFSYLGCNGVKSTQSSPYLSSISVPSSYSLYGGTSSNYGGLLLPGQSTPLTSVSLYSALISNKARSSTSHYRKSYSPNYGSPSSSRLPSRTGSFNRHHSSYSSPASRIGSTSSLATSEGYESGPEKLERAGSSSEESKDSTPTTENGEIDYKKLYEECLAENEKLRQLLQVAEENLKIAKSQAENTLLHKNSLSEAEKRERRTLERKLSEMEEELKQLQKLKADNERLRADNLSLTRVVSKLSATFSRR